jgi:hypothetical protein
MVGTQDVSKGLGIDYEVVEPNRGTTVRERHEGC